MRLSEGLCVTSTPLGKKLRLLGVRASNLSRVDSADSKPNAAAAQLRPAYEAIENVAYAQSIEAKNLQLF